MTLVRFISLSCHFIFFSTCFFLLFFLFFSLTSFVAAGSERGGSGPAVTMERTGARTGFDFSSMTNFSSRQSVSVLISPAVPPFLRILERYQVLKEEREEGTSSPWTCNILWTTDEQTAWLIIRPSQEQMTDNDDEEMRWSPPPPCPRERDGIDFSMMAQDWSISWMPVVSPALGARDFRTSSYFSSSWPVIIPGRHWNG